MEFTYKGKQCVIAKNMFGAFCGYVETKFFGLEYFEKEMGAVSPDSMIECHGGVTFSGTLPGYDGLWFFGMDFAHFGDKVTMPIGEKETVSMGGKEWNEVEVKREVEKMCESVVEYENEKRVMRAWEKLQKKKEKRGK